MFFQKIFKSNADKNGKNLSKQDSFSKRLLATAVLTLLVFQNLLFLSPIEIRAAVPGNDSNVFINEFHYDNTGTDTGEFIEIAGPAGTNLSNYSIVLYRTCLQLVH